MRFLIIFMLFVVTSVAAQTKKESLSVRGNCGMCKERIETAAIKTKGVKYAVWQTDKEQLQLIYNAKKTSVEQVAKNIAAVGHEANGIVAADSIYTALPMCCKYREGNPHDNGYTDK